ncbi:RNA-splicing ligase RtcB, repairs tRNA damage [Faunimonas pinastri]|uniref:3'-phosphate/5'-hydroxy nucleic acid ligase n=1 Tax=Faunimonas pinastri TaxID=1855383 RepID=A0A1H9MUT4_9HYPH|nr:RtcB family protein [Faunimonas pinastri]SER27165.1 RNA-splicing ligase RtcB, repairs tRNA damage [Faunimonas pinastri]
MITGKTLIEWGYQPASWFGAALHDANDAEAHGATEAEIRAIIAQHVPPPVEPRGLRAAGEVAFHLNIHAEGEGDADNIAAVSATMQELMRVPTVEAGAVMPDACPAGVIPVGGVVAVKGAIHPGFHSADICCSVAVANLGRVDPKEVLDRAMTVTHFGPGGRQQRDQHKPSAEVMDRFERNRFLQWHLQPMISHFATQGDGNHFLYVGTLQSTGDTVVVTHHGSRGPGARLYKAGMQDAERFREKLAPEVPKAAAWIPFDTKEGQDYWEALQAIKDWTRESHFKIHQLIGFPINDWFWNEHNFIFQRGDTFFHAKGATPGWAEYDRTIVPLNMAEPILITRGTDAANGLGFLPHGAGRNMSRTQFLKESAPAAWPEHIDVRSFCGTPDFSEHPNAYKSAATVRSQIAHYGLAEIVDEILPYGSIMAGDQPQPWRKK